MRTVAIPMEELAQLLDVQLQHDGWANLTVTGSSMYPMLRHRRDTVRLVLPEGTPEKNAIILYRRDNGQYVLHRIVKVTGSGEYLCAGDNQWETEAVAVRQVIAVVDGFRRKGKNYTLRDAAYRLYVWIWVGLLPLRRPILALRRRLGRLKRRLLRRRSK